METRLASLADLAAIQALHRELQPDDPELADDRSHTIARHIFETPGLDFVLLADGNDVLGSIFVNVIPNLTRGGRPYAVFENVIVRATHRGTGLGKRVMQAALDHAAAQDCYKVMLMTGSSNPNTHAFYRACGFDGDAKHAYVFRS